MQGLKEYSEWPTYPQLYAKGEFLGGCDIVMGLKEQGQLQSEILAKAGEGVLKESMTQKCERVTTQAPVMLFMKGTPSAPRCKFSSRVVQALEADGISFSHFDILQDQLLRQGLKNFAQWPTYPQLYVKGEFLGGCDIIEDLHTNGKLSSQITSLLQKSSDNCTENSDKRQ